jgi:hypothetical protein
MMGDNVGTDVMRYVVVGSRKVALSRRGASRASGTEEYRIAVGADVGGCRTKLCVVYSSRGIRDSSLRRSAVFIERDHICKGSLSDFAVTGYRGRVR